MNVRRLKPRIYRKNGHWECCGMTDDGRRCVWHWGEGRTILSAYRDMVALREGYLTFWSKYREAA